MGGCSISFLKSFMLELGSFLSGVENCSMVEFASAANDGSSEKNCLEMDDLNMFEPAYSELSQVWFLILRVKVQDTVMLSWFGKKNSNE